MDEGAHYFDLEPRGLTEYGSRVDWVPCVDCGAVDHSSHNLVEGMLS